MTKEKPTFEEVIEKEPFFNTEDGKLREAILNEVKKITGNKK